LNGDSGTSYAFHSLEGTGSSVASSASTSSNQMDLGISTIPTSLQSANIFGGALIDILDFASSSKNTTLKALAGSAQTDPRLNLASGLFINTNAVTSTELFSNSGDFVAGSRFSLYGLKGTA